MTNQQILEKAIQKAIDSGFNFDHWRRRNGLAEGEKPNGDIETSLIFNHDFAKALWGEYHEFTTHSHVTRSEMPGYVDTTHPLHTSADIRMVQEEDMRCFSCDRVLNGPYWIRNEICWRENDGRWGWQYHLQQMVIADDPIKYLGENI